MLREKYHYLAINFLTRLPALKSTAAVLAKWRLPARVAAVLVVASGVAAAQLWTDGWRNTGAETALANNQGQQCSQPVFYGVADENLADSNFFKYDVASQVTTIINTVLNADVESIDTHPETGLIYGLTGDYGDPASNKKLIVIDPASGIPDPLVGLPLDIPQNSEYKGASFNPVTSELWASGHDIGGLKTIDLTTGNSELEVAVSGEVEAIAWNLDGTSLYYAKNDRLYRYDPGTGTTTNLCAFERETEGLEFDPNTGNLLVGYHPGPGTNVKVISPVTCLPLPDQPYQISLPDPETFTWVCEQEPPHVTTLIVIKHVINDSGTGSKLAQDFTMSVTAQNPSQTSFPGDEAGVSLTVDPGQYSVDEVDSLGYNKTLSADCTGTITAGVTKTCTITNDDIPPNLATLIVIKHVINDSGTGSKLAQDFTMSVTAQNPSQTSFPGDEAGVSLTVDPGQYSVDEVDSFNYTKTKSADCTGTITAGVTKTCTITNDDPSGGGGGGCTGASCNPSPTPVNATITCGPNATLSFSYGSDVTSITISNHADFSGATSISPVPTLAWSVPAGDGHKVYVKFQRHNGSIEIRQAITSNCTPPPPEVLGCTNLVAAEADLVKTPNQALTASLRGRILLQSEAHGELWYLNPADNLKYYLPGSPHTLTVLQLLAAGITNDNLAKIPLGLNINTTGPDADNDGLSDSLEAAIGTNPTATDSDGDGYDDKVEVENGYDPNGSGRPAIDRGFAAAQSGRLFLQVEGAGQIWYVNPDDGKRYFMPADSATAYNILASFKLGISNTDIRRIPVATELKAVSLGDYAGCFGPTPQVLGATELPRTGFPFDLAQLIVLPSLAAYPWFRRRYAAALADYFNKLMD